MRIYYILFFNFRELEIIIFIMLRNKNYNLTPLKSLYYLLFYTIKSERIYFVIVRNFYMLSA